MTCTGTLSGSNPIVTVTDPTGNPTTGTVPAVIDLIAPVVPSVGPATTTNPLPVLSGSCESGTTVTLSGVTCSPNPQTWSASGDYMCTATSPLSGGVNPVTVTSCDAAGNCTTTTGSVTVSL